ncbi:MAG: peptidoglycan editing factor PgeF [Gammaproteobacteria bacterium]|nr:peptidoglycan editing factor PgeF [Gammaproteobacteria bacterium]
MNLELILPDWPAPARVRALTTTRQGGVSLPPYESLNLGDHVGDAPEAVAENRQRLRAALGLPAEPRWLNQVHGIRCCDASAITQGAAADAQYAQRPGVVCAVLTADCLPLLLCDAVGTRVAAVHAGWRGLLEGVIENSVEAMGLGGELLAWLGPAIGPDAFEVGAEVRDLFIGHDPHAAAAFAPSAGGKWLADLYRLARQRLAACGVHRVYGGGYCTFSEPHRFYSYRRDGQTGRIASLIWLEN